MSISSASARKFLPLLLLILVPILIRLPALLGTFNPDPMYFTASVGDAGRHFSGTPWIDPNVGFQGQALGKLSADQWLAGRIPWWNSYNGVGLPLAAEVQPASLFLPFVLLMHFRSGGMWLELLLQILAGLCTFALLRRIGLTRTAAFAGALIFELNGTFAWHGAPISSPIAFLPMLLLGIEQLRARVIENAKGGWVLIPVALAYSIYAGFPEIAYINGLLAGIWILSRLAGLNPVQIRRFLGVLCWAVFIGLLCAVPLIVPFTEFLGRAYVGGHVGAFVHARLPTTTLAQSLMPWLYGPIFAFDDPKHFVYMGWANVGGYFTALQFFIVLLGAAFSRRWLYAALLGWVLVCLAKTFDIRPISDMVNLLPLIKATAFFRYAPPSWEFAGAVLCALAIDDLQRRTSPSRGVLVLMFALAGICISMAFRLARTPLEALLKNHAYLPYFHWATGWAVASMLAALLLLLLRHRWRHALHGLVLLLMVDAGMAFALPLRSGMTHTTKNEAGIAFLRANAGLQRVYSLGPLAPNYGAYFRVAQINHNYLPISLDWLEYLRRHINPKVNPIAFEGAGGSIGSADSPIPLFRTGTTPYRELGVKYILAPAATAPFEAATRPMASIKGKHEPLQLASGSSTTISWVPHASAEKRMMTAIQMPIGNYRGHSDGLLQIAVCNASGSCAQGRRELANSVDNAPFRVTLDQPLLMDLPNQAPSRLTVTVTHLKGSYPVVLWSGKTDPSLQVVIDGTPSEAAPAISLGYRSASEGYVPKLVYSGADMEIYELPDPAPYFEATHGNCALIPIDRETVEANCESAARLIRREAFYPGWRASVGDHLAPIARADELFQGVSIPAGKYTVHFSYRPTHAWWLLASLVAGLLLIAASVPGEFRRMKAALRGRDNSSGARSSQSLLAGHADRTAAARSG